MMGDMSIYSYYFGTIGFLPLALFVLAGASNGFLANFPRVWLTFWSSDAARVHPLHGQGFYIALYGLLQTLCLSSFVCAGVLVLHSIVRVSGAVLHHRALDTLINAPLSLFTTLDTGVLVNHFSQDMTLIDGELPIAMINFVLDCFSVLAMAAVLASSSPWLALSYPVILAILWCIQRFYLRTSRQLRLLDLEAKSPLYTHFLRP